MTTIPLTDQQLNDIDARQKAATPGPWTVSEDYSDVLDPDGGHLASYWNPTSETRNGEFIAHARTDVPALLDEVRRLRAELADFSGRVNEMESRLCKCQPVREHQDFRRAAFYQHEAHCPVTQLTAVPTT